MQFSGKAFKTSFLEDSDKGKLFRVDLDLHGTLVNVFNDAVFAELNQVLEMAENDRQLGGLIFTSSKRVFVAGADIAILLHNAKHSSTEEIGRFMATGYDTFNRLQALPVATAAAINGAALGGGLEFALAMDTRVMAMQARIGLPEVSLGIFPGWGGTVRLPRMIAPETAAAWIAGGKPQRADMALKAGLVAAITTQDDLLNAAIAQLKIAQSNFTETRAAKMRPIKISAQSMDAIKEILSSLALRPGRHYPAGKLAIKSILAQAPLGSLAAREIELGDFSDILSSDMAINLLSVFMNEQTLGRIARTYARDVQSVKSIGVIGAGGMGSGIAYQAALNKISAVLKDIQRDALVTGMENAERNFSELVAINRMNEATKAAALRRLKPTVNDRRLRYVDVVVEAVSEDEQIKKSVLGDLQGDLDGDTVIASSTSTISISRLAEDIDRPENFCGMHFLNPLSSMPLVEIVRGTRTTEQTISRMVGFALKMGKKPVVVNDGPGFFVNRVLFSYLNAAHLIINEGVDFQFIDSLMEDWGWPMGPAQLSDVIGIDTLVHCLDVMAAEIPDRMALGFESANHLMLKHQRLGQKNGMGFYLYTPTELGRITKQSDETVNGILYQGTPHVLPPEQIVDRLILAICLETVRCLEDEIVATPAEADMALLWGLGFPKFRGGAIRHIDTMGIDVFCQKLENYQHLGFLYDIPELLAEKRDSGTNFYG